MKRLPATAITSALAASGLFVGATGPASGTPLDSGTVHDEFTLFGEDSCDVPGFTVRVDGVVDLRFRLNSRGADRLPYLNEHRTQTLVSTNLATGEFVTIESRENGNDMHATEQDGILTYVTVHTGPTVMYDMNGKAIARDTGQARLKVVFDDGGTPTDVNDDVLVDAVPLKETGLPGIDFCAETVRAIG